MIWQCDICGESVRSQPWTEVTGWERKREQGGTNHVALREPTGRAMCNTCMVKLQTGLAPAQMSL